MIEEIKLSGKTSIYKTKYNWEYDQKAFIKRAYEIEKFNEGKPWWLSPLLKNNVVPYLLFDCLEFKSINSFALEACKQISKVNPQEWAIRNWVFVSDGVSDLELNKAISEGKKDHDWHIHSTTYDSFEQVKTDWTFCFYIQIPDELKDNEGKIVFRTEDSKLHYLLPEEGDIYIFPGTLEHATVHLLEEKNKARILIAGNISLDPLKYFKAKKVI